MEKINLLKQQEQLDSRHANTTDSQIDETAAHIKSELYHTCDIFLEPDREIWDFSEGDWGLRSGDFCAVKLFHISVKNWHF